MPIEIDNVSLFVSLEWLAKLLENFVQLRCVKVFEITFGFVIIVKIWIKGKPSPRRTKPIGCLVLIGTLTLPHFLFTQEVRRVKQVVVVTIKITIYLVKVGDVIRSNVCLDARKVL